MLSTHDQAALVRGFLDDIDDHLATYSGDGVSVVRYGIREYRTSDYQVRVYEENPVLTAWLPRCLEVLSQDASPVTDKIADVCNCLSWVTYDDYDPEEIGPLFGSSHAYASIIGEDAPLFAPDFDFGLFLIAPQVLYRDHCHAAPELYLPLTGPHGWRFVPDAPLEIKQAHELIWNDPGQPHLTKVGPEPFFSLYCWTSDNDKPAVVVPAGDWAELDNLRL